MNQVIECLTGRRSVRSFLPDQVEEQALCSILLAGQYAPTGRGAQSPRMVVVQDKQTIALLSRLNAEVMGSDKDPFYGAPTVIVVFADSQRNTYLEDGSLVMGNLMNAAFALGVDSCWIHRAREVFDGDEGKALKRKWGVEERYVGIGNCILGYRDGALPAPKPRKEDYVLRV